MKHFSTPCACALLSLLLTCSAAVAAPAAPSATGESSGWYQVEIIVFAQLHPTPADEIFPASPRLEYPANMVAISPLSNNDLKPVNLAELTQLLGTSANTGQQQNADQQTQATPSGYMFADKSRFYHQPVPASQTTQQNSQAAAAQAEDLAAAKKIFDAHLPRAFRALPDSALHLNGVAHSIELSSLYRLLLHVGWLQPIPKDGTSWPVLVQGGERVGPDYEIDGTLTVSRERYLHVETNLWFSQFKKKYDAAPPLPAVVTNLDAATRNKYPELVDAAEKGVNYVKVQSYIMRMSHRMRDDTLHYLDNPFFGVLIQVSEFNYTPPAGAQSTSPTSSP